MPQTEKTIKELLEENQFELPIGIEINGEFHKTVKISEMTGVTEEAIADPKVRDNGGKMLTEAIYGILEKLGNMPEGKKSKTMVRNMYNADRDFILLMNHKVSVGDTIEYVDNCGRCGSRNNVKVDIDKIPVSYMTQDEPKTFKLELPRGIKDAEGKVYKKITVSIPTGMVQEQLFPLLQKNPKQAITQMLAFICEDIEGLSHWNPDTFREMTKKDRDFISDELSKVKIGPDLAPNVECADCGNEFRSVIPVMTLLGE